MIPNKQTGFTLVELMVAMAIGAVIILGAGQLFFTTFQTFKTVDELSRKQEALIFAVSTLIDNVRGGDEKELDEDGDGDIAGYGIRLDKRGEGSDTRYYCVLQNTNESQPLVDLAQIEPGAPCPVLASTNSDGLSYTLTLLVGDCRENSNAGCDEISFRVTQRSKNISV